MDKILEDHPGNIILNIIVGIVLVGILYYITVVFGGWIPVLAIAVVGLLALTFKLTEDVKND